MTDQPMTLGAILYPGFEMLDLFGPLEMFSLVPREQLTICMLAEKAGPVVNASGVSAGTDMALAIIQRLWGHDMAHKVAEFAEYNWHKDADSDPFVAELNKAASALGLI